MTEQGKDEDLLRIVFLRNVVQGRYVLLQIARLLEPHRLLLLVNLACQTLTVQVAVSAVFLQLEAQVVDPLLVSERNPLFLFGLDGL